MKDKEFLERADIILEELLVGAGNLAIQDYENLNLFAIELHKRMDDMGARKAKELKRNYQANGGKA